MVVALLVAAGSVASADSRQVVTTETERGVDLAQQVVAASGASGLAQSRVIFLDRGGVHLKPGDNDSSAGTSTVVQHPVYIPAWETTPETWGATVACVSEVFARFDVTVTDVDPGEVPHLHAVFGGSPTTLGLARNIAGISPFTEDCAVIERSVVFTFTDILPDDARAVCDVAAQEIAHSYGLDHELLATDPMSCLHTADTREFADQDVACGESTARPCGLAGSTCRTSQNSYALLATRLGLAGTAAASPGALADRSPESLGCAATSGPGSGTLLIVLACVLARRRTAFACGEPEH